VSILGTDFFVTLPETAETPYFHILFSITYTHLFFVIGKGRFSEQLILLVTLARD